MAELTIQQAFDLALQHHRAGRLQEAEQLYRQILAQQPEHADALHFLGVIAHQGRRNDEAIALIRRAIVLRPNFVEAHINLGNALRDKGQLDEAIAAYGQAIALGPGNAEGHSNFGIALAAKGQFDDALAAFRRAIALRPDYAPAHYNLGNALLSKGQFDAAIAAYRQAIALRPDYTEGHGNFGIALAAKGQLDDALAAFRRAIALRPDYAPAHYNLGNALVSKGQFDAAIAAYRQAIALDPNLPKVHNSLGNALKDQGQLDEAVAAYRQAIALDPNFLIAYNNLGNALKDQGQLDEAVTAYRQAIALDPNFPTAYNNLGNALKELGQLDEAIDAYRHAISLRPSHAVTHSNLLAALHYHPGYDAPAIAEELGRWNRQHAQPLGKFIAPHGNDRNPHRRLRIGYVSADFRKHASAYFLVPLLRHHHPREVEVFCYSTVVGGDTMTQEFQGMVQGWRNIVGMSDEGVARQIRGDGIDILVDLKLHTNDNRLLVFARKPAPVQATWLGYPGSTGLETMDYRLSDPYLDPPGMDEPVCSERTMRLPDCFWCYDPLSGGETPIKALPAVERGFVTFGCLNSFCKVNDGMFALWIKLMSRVADSRLLLLAPVSSQQRRVAEIFARGGIAPSRVAFTERRPRREYLELYNQIDLSLDTLPYNGHTTSLDSLWMGVPVVSLAGATVVGRAGVSQLTNLGLSELIAWTPEQYVATAVELCGDLPRLTEMRGTLRGRMLGSPLCDAARFARNIEAAYRQMWANWCATAPS